jgi:hypothetical protein
MNANSLVRRAALAGLLLVTVVLAAEEVARARIARVGITPIPIP